MREYTFLPGNFSTLYRCPKQKVNNMVNRLSYDPYERREQLVLTNNPDGKHFMNVNSLTRRYLLLTLLDYGIIK